MLSHEKRLRFRIHGSQFVNILHENKSVIVCKNAAQISLKYAVNRRDKTPDYPYMKSINHLTI